MQQGDAGGQAGRQEQQGEEGQAATSGLQELLTRPELAALRVEASLVTLGGRIGRGSHATVHVATLQQGQLGGAIPGQAQQGQGHKQTTVVAKCLDRVDPEHLSQVGI